MITLCWPPSSYVHWRCSTRCTVVPTSHYSLGFYAKVQEETCKRTWEMELCRAGLFRWSLESSLVQQAGGDVENCLGKVKGTEK